MKEAIVCKTCGSTDVTVKNNICICNVCGNKFTHKMLNSDTDKLLFYINEAETYIGNKMFLDAEKSVINALKINPKASRAWSIRAICVREKIKTHLSKYKMWIDDYIDYISKAIEYDDSNSNEHENLKKTIMDEFDTSIKLFINSMIDIIVKIDYYIDYSNSKNGIPLLSKNLSILDIIELNDAGLKPIFDIINDIHDERSGDGRIENKIGFTVFNFDNDIYIKISQAIIVTYNQQVFNGYINSSNNKVNWGKFINNSNTIKKILYMLNDLHGDDLEEVKKRLKTVIEIDRNILKSTYYDGMFKCNDLSDEKTKELEEEIVKNEGMIKE